MTENDNSTFDNILLLKELRIFGGRKKYNYMVPATGRAMSRVPGFVFRRDNSVGIQGMVLQNCAEWRIGLADDSVRKFLALRHLARGHWFWHGVCIGGALDGMVLLRGKMGGGAMLMRRLHEHVFGGRRTCSWERHP
jgi:hypothetical protein